MGRAEAAAEGDDAGQVIPAVALLGQIAQLGDSFVHDIMQPLLIPADAPVRVAIGVRPGLLVQRVDGHDHELARLDPGCKGVGHVEVLEVEEASVLTGDVQHRPSPVSVDFALHLPAQRRAVFLEILHLHMLSSSVWFNQARTSGCGTQRAAAFPSWPRCGCRPARRGPSG